MDIKNRIINLLKKHSLSEKLIYEILSSSNEVKQSLGELIQNGEIVYYRKEYFLPDNLGLIKGKIISIKDKFSFAKIDEETDVYIDNDDLNYALLDDEVYLIPSRYKKDAYSVFSILKRERTILTGEIKLKRGRYILDVGSIAPKDYLFVIQSHQETLIEGTIARGRIISNTKSLIFVEIISIIGNKSLPGVEITSIIYKYNANIDFPHEVVEQVKHIPNHVEENELINREDFRDHIIVTIDGDDAKDFDDAVEVKKLHDGYEIGVHIADVSHYIKEGTPLDKEALDRGTSIYVTDRVVPMLPFELSNGICSLNPHVERLVQSCIFKIDNYGNVISSRITKGVIKSYARLTYNYVNNLFNGQISDKSIPQEVNDMLLILHEASLKIRAKREFRGALDIDTSEYKFLCDEQGFPYEVKKLEHLEAEKMIEDLMIAANEQVSEIITSMGLPFIYRIHEQPKAKKMETFMKMSAHLGYRCNFSSLKVTPKELQEHMLSINDPKIKDILSIVMLRSLAKARYAIDNKKHYGLASTCYTHFTSPIRRYPDLLVHRLIDRYLVDGDVSINKQLIENIDYIAENSSIKERRSISIEREVNDLMASKYMSNKIGNTYKGYINGMIASGFFVELDNGIDGFVNFESLSDDYYVYNENYLCAIGRRTSRKYSLGDEVEVIVAKVDIKNHLITFELLNKIKKHKMISSKRRRK
jgi:ribonuclease R